MDPKSVWALQCLSSKNVLFWSQYIWCNCNECDMSFSKLVLLSHLLPFEVGPTYRWEKTQRSKAHALGGPYGASLLHQSFVFLALSSGPKKTCTLQCIHLLLHSIPSPPIAYFLSPDFLLQCGALNRYWLLGLLPFPELHAMPFKYYLKHMNSQSTTIVFYCFFFPLIFIIS